MSPEGSLLRDFIGFFRTGWRLFRDPAVPLWVKLLTVALALLYVFFPVDLIPDPILGLGQADDLVVLLALLKLFVELGSRQEAESEEVVDGSYRILD